MIKEKIKAKKKLFEVINKLNNVKINEMFNINEDMYATLITAIDTLGAGSLLSERGGKYEATTQKDGDIFYTIINGVDYENNSYEFKFKIFIDRGLDDDIVRIENIELIEFFFDSNDENETLKLGEDELLSFNRQKNLDFYDIINDYVDINLEDEITKEKK